MTGEGRDGVEADPVHRHGVRVLLTEGQQGRRNRQLAFLLDRRMLGQPAGKADHGAGVAALGIAGTLLLGLVLDGPRQHNRVRVGNDLDACIAQGLGDGGVARGPVKTDPPAELSQPCAHFFGRENRHAIVQRLMHGVCDPLGPDEPVNRAIGVQGRKGAGDGQPGNVIGTGVEQPGDRVRLVDDLRAEPLLRQAGREGPALIQAGQTAVFQTVGHHRRGRRRGLIAPDCVDGVEADRLKAGLHLGHSLGPGFDAADGVHLRVIAQHLTGLEKARYAGERAAALDFADGPDRLVDLQPDGDGVAGRSRSAPCRG